jgi:hypothetical protein
MLRISLQNDVISIRVPVSLRRHGGKKYMILPEGILKTTGLRKPDEALVRALAKARYWQDQIASGEFHSLDDLAKRKKINPSYVSRILRLNQLAPVIKAAILDGRQPVSMDVQKLQKPFPDLWQEQLKHFGFDGKTPPDL